MTDTHLLFLANFVDPNSKSLDVAIFNNEIAYQKIESLLKLYSPSTAEKYIWRLHRYLSNDSRFPPTMLAKYAALLARCKASYELSVLRR